MKTDNNPHFHDALRWLNPVAKQHPTMTTPLTPREIEDKLRPLSFSYRWGHLPHNVLHGSLSTDGFVLQRNMFQQPRLTGKYHDRPSETGIELNLSRSWSG